MKKSIDRRSFLRKAASAGVVIPFMSKFPEIISRSTQSKKQVPVILCSRGESWGKKVLEPAWQTFSDGGVLLDGLEKGANVVELDPEDTSVGYGGLPNEDGVVQLDASVMHGPTHNCGSVAGLENIKTPCSVARLVMERTDHIHLVGEGALRFAKRHGFEEVEMLTEKARKRWLRWKENLSDRDDWLPPKEKTTEEERSTGTINVLGVDGDGDIAGITTTSGLAWKIPGRMGDSPIIGAGLYVDNEVGAAGATGRGEEVIRTCGSFYLVEKMRAGMSPQQACEAICKRIIEINGGQSKVDFNDKFVAVNKQGEVGCASIMGREGREPMLAYMNESGFHVLKGSYLIKAPRRG